MKTPSDELFMLIKSLNRYEKRHFKAASSHGRGQEARETTAYLALFDANDSMDSYNEQELRTRLRKKGGPEKLKRIKSYLQESILKFLEGYYVDFSIEIQLQRHLQRIEVLLEKRLYDMAWKVIGKAEKFALENENHLYLLLLMDWKRKALQRQVDLPEIKKYLKNGFQEEEEVLAFYENLLQYRKLNLQADVLLKTRFEGADEESIRELKTLLKNPYLSNPEKASSKRAKGLYYAILGNIYIYFKEDWEKSNACYKQAIVLQEGGALFQNENARIYLGLLSGLSTTEILLKRANELKTTVEKARDFFNRQSKKMQTGNLQNQYMGILINYISFQVEQFNLGQALQQSEQVKEFIDKHGDEVIYLVFYANYAITTFYLRDYHLSLKCINKILAKDKTTVRRDIINDFRIYNLMVHYELGNEDILPNLTKSARNMLSKGRALNQAEQLILDFLEKKAPRMFSKQERKDAFALAGAELRRIITDRKPPYNQRHYSFLLEWFESKAETLDFLDWSKMKFGKGTPSERGS